MLSATGGGRRRHSGHPRRSALQIGFKSEPTTSRRLTGSTSRHRTPSRVAWEYTPDPPRSGDRHRADPTMILEALAAVTDVTDETRTGIDAVRAIQVYARLELTLIEDRLPEALKPRSANARRVSGCAMLRSSRG
jgi:hypothetical protein